VTFLKTGNSEDDFFLVEFSDTAKIAQKFTTDVNELEGSLAFVGPDGHTAFLDAVYLGLEHVRLGVNPRKALLMITDGEDNRSRYTVKDVKQMLKESDVQIYAVDTGYHAAKGHNYGRSLLDQLTEVAGGRVISLKSMDELNDICAQISRELKSQYVLGY